MNAKITVDNSDDISFNWAHVKENKGVYRHVGYHSGSRFVSLPGVVLLFDEKNSRFSIAPDDVWRTDKFVPTNEIIEVKFTHA